MCVQCLYVQYTNHAATVAETNLHGLITCVMSPYPRTKSACRHPLPPPPAHRYGRPQLVDELQQETTTSTCPQDDLHNRDDDHQAQELHRRRHSQPPPPRHPGASHQTEGSLSRNHRPDSDCHQAEPSVVDPRRRPNRVHISSRRGRSKVRTQFRPRVRTQRRTFFRTGKSAKTPLNSIIGIVKQAAR